jgi:hypothetical protein
MKYFSDYRFVVGTVTVLSGILALVCILVGVIMVDYNFDAFSDPVLTLNYAHNHRLANWFNLLEILVSTFFCCLYIYFHSNTI